MRATFSTRLEVQGRVLLYRVEGLKPKGDEVKQSPKVNGLCVITSPSLVCKQNSSHLHYLCVGILFNWIALGIHLCKTLQLYILKTRLCGEKKNIDLVPDSCMNELTTQIKF